MKRSLSIFIVVIFISLLSGCILSATPKDNPVVMLPGVSETFSVCAFPSPASYEWYADGVLLPGANKKTYTFSLNEVLPSQFKLEVRAGMDKHEWNIKYDGTNRAPTAEAGDYSQQDLDDGDVITLDGSGSTDPDNNITEFHWEQTGGPTVTLTNPEIFNPQFTVVAPSGATYTFMLTVTDAGGLMDTDTCTLTVGPAGPDLVILNGCLKEGNVVSKGSYIHPNCLMYNRGNRLAGGNGVRTRVCYYLNGAYIDDDAWDSSIAPGNGKFGEIRSDVVKANVVGTNTLSFYADCNGEVAEQKEGNNWSYYTFTVQ